MARERMPYQIIQSLTARFDKLKDATLLQRLRDLPPLPDENDPAWDEAIWQDVAYPYLALCGVASSRQLREAIPLILERACFGDPGEIMRGLCHILEGIVRPNWAELTPYCVTALTSQRPGTRMWAAFQLARLRDANAIPPLEAAENDPVPDVQREIRRALQSTRDANR